MPPEPAHEGIAARTGALAARLERHARRLDAEAPGDRLRLVIYTLGLACAFGLDLLVHGPGQGLPFWAAAGLAAAAIASGLAVRGAALGRPFRWGVIGAALIALAVPLGPALAGGEPTAAILAAHPIWPQVLVALFASRVLAEVCDLRFAAFWRAPAGVGAPVQIQSNAAALALGAALTLVFYGIVGTIAPAPTGGTTLTAIVARALAGETAIHRAIVFLFFVILAYLGDAGLHHRRDRDALAALQAALAAGRGAPGLPALLDGPLRPFAHTRTVRALAEAVAPMGRQGVPLAAQAFDAFHAASRRFVRGLLPFLPLLGFFGTVVGLATAMAALPTGGGGGRVDLSGSLSGLALKFETTLLGILASMIASVLLAALEKGEAELAAECALLADAAGVRDAP